MNEVYGDFIEDLYSVDNDDSLVLTFSPSSRPIKQRWRNNRLSAHFVADYLATFFPVSDEDPSSERRKKQAKGAVSYGANELLENAMKFHNNDALNCKVHFGIHLIEKPEIKVVLFVINSLSEEQMIKLKDFIQQLNENDPDEFYIMQLEKSAENDDDEGSGLGLLTMINDYEATLGWKFGEFSSNPQILTVTTMAQIPV